MSRSYRNRRNDKICRDYMKSSGHGKQYKRFANKRTRTYTHLKDGNMYKKVYNSWDIHDYSYHNSNIPQDWKRYRCFRYFLCK